MPIDVSCQSCGRPYSVPNERAGRRFKCKECGTVVSVPNNDRGFGSGDTGFGGNSAAASEAEQVDSHNPYAAPAGFPSSRERLNHVEALSKTNLCAIFLYIVAGLSILNHVSSAVLAIAGQNLNLFANRAQMNEAEQIASIVGGIIGGVIGVTLDVLVLVGAYNLQHLKRFPLAMTGAIIACIPCCGPCFVMGIPFGIWALVLLNNPQIKPHFQ